MAILLLTAWRRVSAEEVKIIFTWSYDHKLISMVYYFDKADYTFYKDQLRVHDSWVHYLKEKDGHAMIKQFTEEFKLLAAQHKWSDWQTAECVINFIQTLQYRNDGEWEYPRYPVETLVEKGGDCEDLAILLEAMLLELGFDCVLISPANHMGVGVATSYPVNGAAFAHRDKDYYYIETTSGGWGIGNYPEHLSAEAVIYDPGLTDTGIALSAYQYSFANYQQQTQTTAQEPTPAQAVPENTSVYKPSTPKRPANTYTIDVDKVVIDGKQETVVTKVVDDGKDTRIAVDSD